MREGRRVNIFSICIYIERGGDKTFAFLSRAIPSLHPPVMCSAVSKVAEEESVLKRARAEIMGVPLPEDDDAFSDDGGDDEHEDSVEALFGLLEAK